MPRQIRNREDENLTHAFYNELDKKTEKKSCCTCLTLTILFVFLAIIILLLSFELFKTFRSKNINYTFPVNVQTDLSNKFDVSAKTPTLKLIITEGELTYLVQTGIKSFGIGLNEPAVKITESDIEISGTQNQILSTKVTIKTFPMVLNDKLYLKINSVKTAGLSFPKMLNSGFEKSLNNVLDRKFENVYNNYKISKTELESGQLIIFGNIK